MDILEFIPFGRENAVKRSDLRDITGLNDRELRAVISRARKETPIINMSDGRGYYQPDDKEDLHRYIMQERARARDILATINVACNKYNEIVGQMKLGD